MNNFSTQYGFSIKDLQVVMKQTYVVEVVCENNS